MPKQQPIIPRAVHRNVCKSKTRVQKTSDCHLRTATPTGLLAKTLAVKCCFAVLYVQVRQQIMEQDEVYHSAMDEAGAKIKNGKAGLDKDGRPLADAARRQRKAIQSEQA